MDSKKYNKLVNISEKKQAHRYREQTSGYQCGRGGAIWGEGEVQAAGCKMGSGMYCTTWEIEPIFGNNCKWKVIFKHCIKKELGFLFHC